MLQTKSTVLAVDSYEFFPPDKIELIQSNNSLWLSRDFIVKVSCIHDDPSTVDPDMYHYLRDLATADIMRFIGKIRTKYQSFASPVGQVDLSAQELLQEGKQLKQETLDKLDRTPPDNYLYVF